MIPIEEVPDPVFSQKMVGDGLAVVPTEGVAVAPIDGVVAVIVGGGHALAMTGPEGTEIIVHAGLETVRLRGEGFTKLVEAGTPVKAGQQLLRFDIGLIKERGHALASPVVVSNIPEGWQLVKTKAKRVRAGIDTLLTLRRA
ncbi:MAG: PTS glucose transporter subunit IIA [Chloroflexi bacterium]|nr:PTS glucose transporter subunit IIA [Chloroflexota bacterium]